MSNIEFLTTGGNAGITIANKDWAAHPLGHVDGWTAAFRTALGMVLNSTFPSYIMWGKEFFVFYNDAYLPILGDKVSHGPGCPLAVLWSEIADAACAIAGRAFAGESQYFKDRAFILERHGRPEQAFFTFSYSPIRDDTGVVAGVLCTIFETTDEVRAHARVRESEDRLQMSLDASDNIGTWSYEPETNQTMVDARFARLFQVDVALARSGTELERFTNMIHPDDRDVVLAAITRSIMTGERYDIEYRIPQLSGKIAWVNAKGKMFEEPETQKKRFAGVAVDVTERKQFEQELFEASRLKDEFLAMLGHELRNPLAPIRAAADLLLKADIDPERVRQTSAIISRQVSHMTRMIDDLLDASRVTRGQIQLDEGVLEASEIVADAIEQVRPLIESRRHHLTVRLAAEPMHVCGDRMRLVQVLANLLNNAAKYTPDGGNIELTMDTSDDLVVLTVTDSGIGMSAEVARRAFEMFSQAERSSDRSEGGLGIGLALVKSLVERHGGSVKAESEGKGMGSQFTVSLPRVEKTEPANVGAGIAPATSQDRLRLLIVDDNTDAANILAMLLDALGHAVTVENDPMRALERARIDMPDACLLDIGLPGMDGNELAARIRLQPESRDAMLIAVTGYGRDEDRRHSSAAGFDHHLVKPIDIRILEDVLRRGRVPKSH